MITFNSLVKPFSSLEGCGDFSVVIERESSHLIVVGDVGGHGSYKVGQVASLIKDTVNANASADIDHLFKIIAGLQQITKYGVMLFVGRIDNHIPLLNYMAVGDLKVRVFRNNISTSLQTQDGMVGTFLPLKLNRYAYKLQNADLVSVTSDGVNRTISKVIEQQSSTEKLSELNKSIIQQAGSVSDDSLSLLIRYNQTGAPQPSPSAKPHKALITQNNAEIKEQLPIKPALRSSVHNSIAGRKAPKAQHLFCTLDNDHLAKDKIHSLLSFLDFPRELDLKLQTVILELLYHSQASVKLYFHADLLQIQFAKEQGLFENCRTVFGDRHLFKSDADDSYMICFHSPKKVDVDCELFRRLKERVAMGVTSTAYEQYLKDKKRDETLAQQAKLASMGEMIGSIAHQWRQPLNELAIRIQTLKYQIKQTEDVDKLLASFSDDSLATIKFMSNTIDDFRDFFRVDKEQQVFSVKKAIEQVKNMLVSQTEKLDIQILIEGEDMFINSYQSEIQQVLLNLMSNSKDALKYSNNPNKKIEIKINANQIVITDNGGGIPDAIKAHIFDPYYTTKGHGEGSGIGLYMSKLIVDNHLRGKLTFKNITTSDAQLGAQFTIDIPADAINA